MLRFGFDGGKTAHALFVLDSFFIQPIPTDIIALPHTNTNVERIQHRNPLFAPENNN